MSSRRIAAAVALPSIMTGAEADAMLDRWKERHLMAGKRFTARRNIESRRQSSSSMAKPGIL